MAKIVACCNAKGGTGKTTVAINLAACLATHFHRRVLAIDLDPQGNLALGLGLDPTGLTNTTFRFLLNDMPDPAEYIIHHRKNLDLMPNALESGMEAQLAAKRNREKLLDLRLRDLVDDYDYIILDTPPALETPTVNAMVAADEILIVINCGYYALYGLTQLMQTIASIQRDFEKHGIVIRAILNYFDRRQNMDRQIFAEVESFFESLMLDTVINKNVKIAEAASAGQPLVQYDTTASGYFDFVRLTKELLDIYEQKAKATKEGATSRHS